MKGGFSVGERITGVGFRDSLWLVVPLLLGVLPLAPKVGMPVVAGFCLCGILHLRGVWAGAVCAPWVRWVLLGLGIAGVYFVHHSLWGMEPGMTVFLTLYGIKVLELRTRRDYQVAACLGYFLLLCGFFYSQEFVACLYAAAVFLGVTATLLRFHSMGHAPEEPAPGGFAEIFPAFRSSLVLLAQALPVVLILFFFFPRSEGFGLQLFRPAMTGMSDTLSPGGIEKLVENAALAFRARFINGSPSRPLAYWRGLVLWECHGLEWERGARANVPAPFLGTRATVKVEQEIVIEPHGKRWLFAMDKPLFPVNDATMMEGQFLLARKPVDFRQLYRVVSGNVPERILTPAVRANALGKPPEKAVSPRVRALADSWQGTPKERVLAAKRYFSQGFTYTLAAGAYQGTGWQMLDELLFERKQGFCSHYAAAFASLMRLCGVPSRIVMGYYGGEYNPVGGFYSVYQSDAHAWCEVWLEEEGWVRIDPTALVTGAARDTDAAAVQTPDAPESASPLAETRAASQAGLLRKLRYQWGALNYNWSLWVLGYDHDTQREFLNWLGLRRIGLWIVFGASLGAIFLFLSGLWLFLRRRGETPADPLSRAYAALCRKLARTVSPRLPAETPFAYLERVVAARPDLREPVTPLFTQYVLLRYAPWKAENYGESLRDFRRGVGRLAV